MILEGELFYFWNKDRTERQYLHLCDHDQINLKPDPYKYKKIKNYMTSLKETQVLIV